LPLELSSSLLFSSFREEEGEDRILPLELWISDAMVKVSVIFILPWTRSRGAEYHGTARRITRGDQHLVL
jgi:hypothetical protein